MNLQKKIFGFLPTGFTNLFRSPTISHKTEGRSVFYLMRGANVTMPFTTSFQITQGIPHAGAVVGKLCDMFSTVKFKVVKTNTSEEEIDTGHSLNNVLASPNKAQTWKQFLYMNMFYKLVGGVSFLYPGFGLSQSPSKLSYITTLDYEGYNKNYSYTGSPYANDDIDNIITSIDFDFKYNKTAAYKPSELLWFKDTFVSYTDDYTRFTSLMKQFENIYKVLVARGILIDKKGGIGIISGNQKDSGMSVPMSKKEKKAITARLDSYGLGDGQESIILTDVPLHYTPMVFPTRELMLFEEIEDAFFTICDRLGCNREIFANNTTFSNKEMAERATYVNTIIPAWYDFFELLNKGLHTSKENIKIVPDFSHVRLLQESEKEKIDTETVKSQMLLTELDRGLIDEDEYRQQMGYAVDTEREKETENKADDETTSATIEAQSALRGSVGGVQGILSVQQSVAQGTTDYESAIAILTIVYGFTDDQARSLLGKPKPAKPLL